MSERFLNQDHPMIRAERARKENEILHFVEQIQASAAEFSRAYELALGITPETPLREEVYQLARTIDEATKNGIPLDAIIDMIEKHQDYENPEGELSGIVELLSITDKEKAIINSIIAKKRAGELTIYTRDMESELGNRVITKALSQNQRQVADVLISFLGNYVGEEIQITFSESA